MKIIDICIIAALLISLTLASAFIDQSALQRDLPIPSAAGSAPAINQNCSPMSLEPTSHTVNITDVPGAQIVVGLFGLVFGAIAFLPLFVKTRTDTGGE